MKTAVLVAPYFAPSSMPPALRMAIFARHLSGFGWHPIVLTIASEYLEGPADPENRHLLPHDLEVIRTKALPVSVTRRMGFSDISIRALPFLWNALATLCECRRPDLVFISVPPNVTMPLGRLAFQRFRVPYVVDYQDPWVIEDYWRMPKSQRPPKWPLAYAISRILEPFAISHVSHITGVSKGTTDSVLERYEKLTAQDATEIPFGVEPAEFEYLRAHPRSNRIFDRNDGLFHIGYVGAYVPAMQETVKALFQAICLGLEQRPDVFQRVRIHFVGTTYAAIGLKSQVLPLAAEAGLQQVVTEHPERVGYLDALQLMLDSDALLMIGSNAPHYTASKVFPSILSRTPILAIFHRDSSIVKILQDTRAGAVVCFDEGMSPESRIPLIYEHLSRMLGCSSKPAPATDWDMVENYTARAMTGRLAEVLDRVTAACRTV